MTAIRHCIRRFSRENLSDTAAALTYYAMLSIFPAMIVVVALVGLLGRYPETTDKILQMITELGPDTAVETFRGPVEGVVRNNGGAGALFGVGLLVALWSASGYVGAFMRASNEIYELPKDRRLHRKFAVRLGLTILMTATLAVVAIGLVLSGPLAKALGGAFGLSDTALTIWRIAKWPVMLLLTVVAFSLLYFASPNARHPGIRSILPGALLAVGAWIFASVGFAIYVSNFGSYDKTYGTLGAVIVLLLWLYISNNALLFGALFNAERHRSALGPAGEAAIDIDLRDSEGRELAQGRRHA
ncbi:MAG: YihY/virulence factor BrkB family protein [Actinomycetota bacterium]